MDFEGTHAGTPVVIGVQFTPNGDKNLNTQPWNYNDAAVNLTGYIYKQDPKTGLWSADQPVRFVDDSNGGHYEYETVYSQKVEGYPAQSGLVQMGFVPEDDTPRKLVFTVNNNKAFVGDGSTEKFNFSYSIGLIDTSEYSITKAVGEDRTLNVSTNAFSGGVLSDVNNRLDTWKLTLDYKENTDKHPAIYSIDGTGSVTAGVDVEFTEKPSNFSSGNLFVDVMTTADYGANGESALSIGGSTQNSQSIGANAYVQMKVDDGQRGPIGKQPCAVSGSWTTLNYESSTQWNKTAQFDKHLYLYPALYGVVGSSGTVDSVYDFIYRFSVDEDKYELDFTGSDVEFEHKDGYYTVKQSVSNTGKYLHTVKIAVREKTPSSSDDSVYCAEETGLPTQGIILTSDQVLSGVKVNVYPKATSNKKNGTVNFVVDYYKKVSGTDYIYYYAGQGGYTYPYSNPLGTYSQQAAGLSTGTYNEQFINTENDYYLAYRGSGGSNMPSVYSASIGSFVEIPVNLRINEVEEVNRLDVVGDTSYGAGVTLPAVGLNNPEVKYYKITGETSNVIACVHPIEGNGSDALLSEYDFDYTISYDNGGVTSYGVPLDSRVVLDKVEQYKSGTTENKQFVMSDKTGTYGAEGTFTTQKFNINSATNPIDYNTISVKEVNNSKVENKLSEFVTGAFKMRAYNENNIETRVNNYENVTVDTNNIKSAMIINTNDIIDKEANENPYLNIDLTISDNGTKEFISLIGQLDANGKFTAREQNTGDWINTGFTYWSTDDYGESVYTNDYNQTLSSEYTYTLHAHVQKDDTILIIPKNVYLSYNYDISVRNYSDYNIDSLTINPIGQVNRTVDNNIHYTGKMSDVYTAGGDNAVLNLKFKGIKHTNSAEKQSETQTTKYIPVNLFDYDFGSEKNFDISKQNSVLKFLYEPAVNADATVNMWQSGVLQNIVKHNLVNGLPVFNYTTPFNNLFTVEDETDSNGNTKKATQTYMEFLYDEDKNMYTYNSTLHAASYNKKTNMIDLYNSAIGIDNWGLQGAGFFPFNSFDDLNKWGSASSYNQGMGLIDKENINYHFGMALNTTFKIPEGNVSIDKEGNKNDIIFTFSGDDDVWVFVDDELVLDLGGIHEAAGGEINFTKGVYTINGITYPLKSDGSTAGIATWGTDAWAEGTTHNLSMFYLERGGTLSNALMTFNVAINESEKYGVTYDSNGADSGEVVDNTQYFTTADVEIKSGDSLRKHHYQFTEWNTKADGTGVSYQKGSITKLTDNLILYAQWQETDKHGVVYDNNGADEGEVVDTSTYFDDDDIIVKSGDALKRTGYRFAGWNDMADGSGTAYNPEDIMHISDDLILYAQWDEVEQSDPESEPETDDPSDPEPDPVFDEPSEPDSEPEKPAEPESEPEQKPETPTTSSTDTEPKNPEIHIQGLTGITETSDQKEEDVEVVKTGDNAPIKLAALAGILSGLTAVFAFRKKKKSDEK